MGGHGGQKPALISQTNKRRPETSRAWKTRRREGGRGWKVLPRWNAITRWGDTDTRSGGWWRWVSYPPSQQQDSPLLRSALDLSTPRLYRSSTNLGLDPALFLFRAEISSIFPSRNGRVYRYRTSFHAYDFTMIFMTAAFWASISYAFTNFI